MDFLRNSLRTALDLYLDTAPFLLLGCLLGGLVYAFFPGRVIERWLGGKSLWTVVGAALAGTPLPLCSCGVVPTAVTLKRRGASTGATVAFVVATPETGPDSILVSFALLDPLFALFRPLAAILTAVTAGLLAGFGEKRRLLPLAPPQRLCEICALPDEGEHHHTVGSRLKRALVYAFRDLLEDLGGWLLVGLVLAGVLATAIRPEFVQAHLASPLAQMVAAMVVGVPLYVCASASTPLAAAAIAAGFCPGAALVLMLTGPATNLASLLVLRRELGGRVVALMLAGIAGASLGLGMLLNALYGWSGLKNFVRIGATGEALPHLVRVGGGVVLAILLLLALVQRARGTGRAQECSTCKVAELTGTAGTPHRAGRPALALPPTGSH